MRIVFIPSVIVDDTQEWVQISAVIDRKRKPSTAAETGQSNPKQFLHLYITMCPAIMGLWAWTVTNSYFLESTLIVLLISKILKTCMFFVYVYRTILLEKVRFFTVFIPSKSVRHGDTWRYIMIYSSKSDPTTPHFYSSFVVNMMHCNF
jgi:hypothetical protein